jgi:CheY-like chemotaxis protein
LHELATNAAKYGALSVPAGRVRLAWELRPGTLALHWSESGGPAVVAPTTKGYGTRVISASIERQLGGEAVFDWRREGLQCALAVPRSDKVKDADRDSSVPALGAPADRPIVPQVVTGNGLLLVEDEALVAMAMRDLLGELGFDVTIASTAGGALAAARDQEINAALLDVNLGGELIYPLADYLAARGVPFAFVTGYGAETIDRRFDHVPVLQKPIERQVLESVFVVRRRSRVPPRRAELVDDVAERARPMRTHSSATSR